MPNAGGTSTRTTPWWPSRSGPRTTPGSPPLLCVGERDGGQPAAAADFVFRQIESAVDGDWDLAGRLVVAYEPVWAIGAAEPAAAAYVSDVVQPAPGPAHRRRRARVAGHLRRIGQAGTAAHA